jgi:two-component sensor histidine kinase
VVETDGVVFRSETAIPCGMIVNELVTNAIKHAFSNQNASPGLLPEAAEQVIRVRLQRQDDQFVLEVCDNGAGMPQDFDWKTARSLGLRLVNRLSEQLHGKLEVENHAGTCFRLTFPGLKPAVSMV